MKDRSGYQCVYAVFINLCNTDDGHYYKVFCGIASSAQFIEGLARMELCHAYGKHQFTRRADDGSEVRYMKEIWPSRFNALYDIEIYQSMVNEFDSPHEYGQYKDWGAYFPPRDVKIIDEFLFQIQKEMEAHEFDIDFNKYALALAKQKNNNRRKLQ